MVGGEVTYRCDCILKEIKMPNHLANDPAYFPRILAHSYSSHTAPELWNV